MGRRLGHRIGLVEGRPRAAATCGRRMSGSDVGRTGRAGQATGWWTVIDLFYCIDMEEGPCASQATGGWDTDPAAFAAIPAADFARVVRASRGAHCRPLHPRLASSLFRF